MNTFEYTCYRGRDRDDWSEGTIQALTDTAAIAMLKHQLAKEGYTLKRSSVKLIENK